MRIQSPKSFICYFVLFVLLTSNIQAQKSVDIDYYLPDIEYKQNITTPQEFLGHQIGDWHITHDQLYFYMKQLAQESDRITLTEYARSHENRPLIYLTVTSVENHKNIAEIKQAQQKLCNPSLSNTVVIHNTPIVIYQGYSIHGNESSGSNAAAMVAYYLAAANENHIQQQLNESVILLDPSYNPDGLNRFANWVNTHKSKNLIGNTSSVELNEPWPRGRTNHYWTDLNRDWLLLTHPESRGRVSVFHEWKPSILTDHHEMSSDATFFFQPGIPSRTNPNTPTKNQDLTGQIAQFHAAALDSIGSMYYSQESFDDFYYGKGSTYPDINGSIGILFEQASSRGHLRETVHGDLGFPFTIRNQVATSLSTQKAAIKLRKQILEYKRSFYKNAVTAASVDPIKGYVIKTNDDAALSAFIDILSRHQIKIFNLNNAITKNGETYDSQNNSYLIPADQQQYKLIKTMFEKVTTYKDSLFYDVSAWTFPLAFDLKYAGLEARDMNSSLIGSLATAHHALYESGQTEGTPYGYILNWNNTMSASVLEHLQSQGIRAKLVMNNIAKDASGAAINRGSIWITSANQDIEPNRLRSIIDNHASQYNVHIRPVYSGTNPDGIDLGSPNIKHLKHAKIAMIIGKGINTYDAGDIWFHLDQRMNIPVVLIDKSIISRAVLADYNRLILPDGIYNDLSERESNSIKEWITGGGTIVALKSSINWLNSQKIIVQAKKKTSSQNHVHKDLDYDTAEKNGGAKRIGGSIFNTKIDLSHPLSFGYQDDEIAFMKRGTQFYDGGFNPYSNPIRYTASPLLSGYMHKSVQSKISNSAMATVHGVGAGSVICFTDNPLFRGYWWGGFKLFNNALLFADVISNRTTSEDEHGH